VRVYIAYMDYETEDRLGYVSITEVKGGYDVWGIAIFVLFGLLVIWGALAILNGIRR